MHVRKVASNIVAMNVWICVVSLEILYICMYSHTLMVAWFMQHRESESHCYGRAQIHEKSMNIPSKSYMLMLNQRHQILGRMISLCFIRLEINPRKL